MEISRAGKIIKATTGYRSFIPSTLPLREQIDIRLCPLLSKADQAIGSLRGINHFVPNIDLIVRRYVEKEALLSSQIEGTQSSLIELWSNAEKSNKSVDVVEVENYFKALNHGIKRLKNDDFPFCNRLLREMHKILMTDVRGGEVGKTPGEFRKSQNWIGGTAPNNAYFVPPIPEEVGGLMSNLEKYFYKEDLPILVKCALIHYQFETIHPFNDGNGRIGRILITLYLMWKDVIPSPILYLSLFFKKRRESYYAHLSTPRETGNFEKWVNFFLEGIIYTIGQVNKTTDNIINLQKEDRRKLATIRSKYVEALYLAILSTPLISINEIAESLQITHETGRILVRQFEEAGVLEQISEGNRNKRYVYRAYLDILQEGCENF